MKKIRIILLLLFSVIYLFVSSPIIFAGVTGKIKGKGN